MKRCRVLRPARISEDRILQISNDLAEEMGLPVSKEELYAVLRHAQDHGQHMNNGFVHLHGTVMLWIAETMLKYADQPGVPITELSALLRHICWISENRFTNKMYDEPPQTKASTSGSHAGNASQAEQRDEVSIDSDVSPDS